jgi:Uma2 family endonuclease
MNQNPIGQAPAKNTKTFPTNANRGVIKNELLDGRIVARTPSNRWHNLITANFAIAIGSRVSRSTCEIYGGDMAVEMGRNSTVFPDLTVVCGEPRFADDNFEVLENPTVAIEIYSPSSRAIDRAQRLEGFLAMPSIRECLLVSETEMRIEHYARQNAKQWIYRIHNEREDVVSLDSINCKLSVAEVYTQVKLRESELSSKAVN